MSPHVKYVDVAGARMSAIGLGTWQFGSTEWGYGADYAEREADAIVQRALDVGITLFDTAEIYGFGRSERILGKALGARRDEAFIASKIFPVLPVGPVVLQRARGSVRRLGIDALDLYQLHQPNPVVPFSATMPAFAQLLDEGVVRHVGRLELLAGAVGGRRRGAGAAGAVEPGALQPGGPAAREGAAAVGAGQRPVDHRLQPVGPGPVVGALRREPPSERDRPRCVARVPSREPAPGRAAARRAAEVAETHHATPSQIALAWLIRRPNVVVIPGASSAAQVEVNAAAADIELTDDEDSALVAASDAFEPLGATSVLPDLIRERLSGFLDRMTGGGSGPGDSGPASS